LIKIGANQTLEISYDNASLKPGYDLNREIYYTSSTPLFRDASKKYNVRHKHNETDRVDFNIQITLPHKFTQNGPGVAVGDVNNDGLEDFLWEALLGTKVFYTFRTLMEPL